MTTSNFIKTLTLFTDLTAMTRKEIKSNPIMLEMLMSMSESELVVTETEKQTVYTFGEYVLTVDINGTVGQRYNKNTELLDLVFTNNTHKKEVKTELVKIDGRKEFQHFTSDSKTSYSVKKIDKDYYILYENKTQILSGITKSEIEKYLTENKAKRYNNTL